MSNRREFMQQATAALGLLAGAPMAAKPPELPVPKTGSDVGSLFPFIQSQAVVKGLPLSYLRASDVRTSSPGRRKARGKLLELLHYSPRKCDPRPEVVEKNRLRRVRPGEVLFNTTPDLRVAAYVLGADGSSSGRCLRSSPLHDHAAFTCGVRRSWSRPTTRHPVLTKLQEELLRRRQHGVGPSPTGLVVVVIDIFYWANGG